MLIKTTQIDSVPTMDLIIYQDTNGVIYNVECSHPENLKVVVVNESPDAPDESLHDVSFMKGLVQLHKPQISPFKQTEFDELEGKLNG